MVEGDLRDHGVVDRDHAWSGGGRPVETTMELWIETMHGVVEGDL